MKFYSVVFQGQLLLVPSASAEEAMVFTLKVNGDRWKYATITELKGVEVYGQTGELLYQKRT